MTLNDEIRRNWSMDVVGMCQELRSLYRRGFPAWTIKLSDGSFGVAIPYDEEDDVNERFADIGRRQRQRGCFGKIADDHQIGRVKHQLKN